MSPQGPIEILKSFFIKGVVVMATRESARLICASNGGNLGFSSSSIIMPIRNISASCPRTLFGGWRLDLEKKELEVENEKINTER